MISESLENTRTQGQVTTARSTALQAIMRWLGRIAVALFAIGIVLFVISFAINWLAGRLVGVNGLRLSLIHI